MPTGLAKGTRESENPKLLAVGGCPDHLLRKTKDIYTVVHRMDSNVPLVPLHTHSSASLPDRSLTSPLTTPHPQLEQQIARAPAEDGRFFSQLTDNPFFTAVRSGVGHLIAFLT